MDRPSLLLFIAAATLPALVVSWLCGWLARRYAPRWGLVDRPGSAHKTHREPIPLGGGIAVALGVIGPLAVLQLASAALASGLVSPGSLPEFARPHAAGLALQLPKLWLLPGAAVALLALGLVDDRRQLGWRLRLVLQAAIAGALLLATGWRATAFIPIPAITLAVSLFWIVALVNAFNMLDNMDGLSAGVAAIAAVLLAAVMLVAPNQENGGPQLFVAGLLLVLVGSLAGFLLHNRPPARLFLGDAGSYFIGFLLALATILATFTDARGPAKHSILAPLFVMVVPLYDMASVIVIRLREGRSPFQADRRHLSHRLVALGFTKRAAVLVIYLIAATAGLPALALHEVGRGGAVVLTALVACVVALVAVLEHAGPTRR